MMKDILHIFFKISEPPVLLLKAIENIKIPFQKQHLKRHLAILLAFLTLNTEGVLAQQEGQQTLFMFNSVALNPAVSGSRDIPTMTLTTRNQWVGFKGAPVQQNLSFHTPFVSKRLGLGLTLGNRGIGITQTQSTSFALSYSPIKTENFQLRFGLQGSIRRLSFKFDDNEQAATVTNERLSRTSLEPQILGNFGMGMYMAYKECFIGISVPYFNTNVIGVNSETPQTALTYPHYYLMGGICFPLIENIAVKASGIVKSVKNAPWGVEVNGSLVLFDKVTTGLSYRAGKTNLEDSGESIDFLIFYQINKKWGIGGAYDYNISPLKKYTDGSFEMVIRYDLKQTELRFSNPRIFF